MSLHNPGMGLPCPICDYPETVVGNNEEHFRCIACKGLRTRYSYDSLQYGENYANNYKLYAESVINTPLNLFRLGLISRWLKKNANILDVGCCIGEFIRFAEKYYDCVGFEPNEVAVAEARNRVLSPIVTSLKFGEPDFKPFECVTLFDVIEHIEKPLDFLIFLRSGMASRGILALTTPNVDVIPMHSSYQLTSWKHYKPKEHLFLYTKQGLEYMLTQAGFEILHFGTEESDIRPDNLAGDILTGVFRKDA